jgi:hypothetical protein
MSLLLLSLSTAASAAEPVGAITWARSFTLPAPESFDQKRSFDAGWIVELRADPALLAPSQIAEPVLYAGTTPAMRFNWDRVGGCVVALIPASVDLATTELYFGSTELPERVDDARAAAELDEARRAGVQPLPADEVARAIAAGGDPLKASDLRDVHAAAMERVAACTSTPSDLQRSGIPRD